MTTQAELVLLQLRELLMAGRFAAGEPMMEVPLAQSLKVSRTPVRLALAALAQEGLLIYTPQRGFAVRGFTIKEIVDAVDTRGRLESMACRAVAARGLAADEAAALDANLEASRALLRKGIDPEGVRRWCELNEQFHQLFVTGCDNAFVESFVRKLGSVPLVASRTIAAASNNADRIESAIARALALHELIAEAAHRKEPDRAEMLMAEHVYQGRVRLREHLESSAVVSPELSLVSRDTMAVAAPPRSGAREPARRRRGSPRAARADRPTR